MHIIEEKINQLVSLIKKLSPDKRKKLFKEKKGRCLTKEEKTKISKIMR